MMITKWLVASVALVAATTQPILKDFLIETAAVTTASSVLLSAVVYFLLPRAQRFIWKTLEEDTARYDDLRVKSFSRQTAAGKEVVRLLLVDELKELKVLSAKSEEYGERLGRLDLSVLEQGKAIQQLPVIANAMESLADSAKDTARTMREIHAEVTDHGKRLERWDGYFEGQRDERDDNADRRHRKRRKNDPDPDDT